MAANVVSLDWTARSFNVTPMQNGSISTTKDENGLLVYCSGLEKAKARDIKY